MAPGHEKQNIQYSGCCPQQGCTKGHNTVSTCVHFPSIVDYAICGPVGIWRCLGCITLGDLEPPGPTLHSPHQWW